MGKITEVNQITNNKFLNFYDLKREDKYGKEGRYFMSSRAKCEDELKLNTKENKPDAVIIFALYGEEKDKVVMIRQYRYAIGDYIYEMPAGLVDEGETYRESATRELKEETGLDFEPLNVNEIYERPFFSSVGMTDESCSMVYGYATGEVDLSGLGDGEEIEVVFVDRNEARRILKEENVSVKCAYQLMHFVHDNEPFAFLGIEKGEE